MPVQPSVLVQPLDFLQARQQCFAAQMLVYQLWATQSCIGRKLVQLITILDNVCLGLRT